MALADILSGNSIIPSPPSSSYGDRVLFFARNALLPSWSAKAATQLMIHPLYRTQIILQTQSCSKIPEHDKLNYFHEKFSAPTLIAADDGLFSLWKTLVYTLVKNIPSLAVQHILQKHVLTRVSNDNLKIAISSILTDIVMYPLDLIEIVYMADRSEDGKFIGGQTFQFKGLLDCIRQMYSDSKEELENSGEQASFFSIISHAFYRGFLFRTVFVSTPTHLLNAYVENVVQEKGKLFGSWKDVTKQGMKNFYSQLTETLGKPKEFLKGKLMFIARSYLFKSLIYFLLYPFDTVSRKLQVNGQPGFVKKYSSVKDCVATTLHEECSDSLKDMTVNNGFLNGYLFRTLSIPLVLLIPPLVIKMFASSNASTNNERFGLLSYQ
ncbi:hypothetical protein NAEGRDRAFT_56845 [Naegleria gruberi]|uniref:Uncharacterized protein n=1 Tax=Naegleria gruberi TaxID=5762 RepID=D2V163_NAEGR|nr:uncharacterized protein NAEGRDRAFT_56845 [Naegleria gruberi]EFC49412.1 hypothetical protein NAEGRDRAFT_56845 [Naegleria gruberi]|eukprot:XP_002682156.1 hypothetical protein NAEGRDRAFT_56845 [Naegleria gruberi strain NEG-M]